MFSSFVVHRKRSMKRLNTWWFPRASIVPIWSNIWKNAVVKKKKKNRKHVHSTIAFGNNSKEPLCRIRSTRISWCWRNTVWMYVYTNTCVHMYTVLRSVCNEQCILNTPSICKHKAHTPNIFFWLEILTIQLWRRLNKTRVFFSSGHRVYNM